MLFNNLFIVNEAMHNCYLITHKAMFIFAIYLEDLKQKNIVMISINAFDVAPSVITITIELLREA